MYEFEINKFEMEDFGAGIEVNRSGSIYLI